MGESALVSYEALSTDGITVLKRLEASGVRITMAAWVPDEDQNWFLELFTPLADKGPGYAYKRLQNALRGFESIVPLSKIRVRRSSEPEVQAFAGAISVSLGSSADVQQSTLNGIFFEHIILLKTP